MDWFPSFPVGLFSALLAVLGAIVSIAEYKGWRRWAMASVFLLLGLGEVLAILKADKIHDTEVTQLKGALETIRRQTETNRHAHVEFDDPRGVKGDPYLPFRTGERPNVGVAFRNSSDQNISESLSSFGLDVAPYPLSVAQEKELWSNSELHGRAAVGGQLSPSTLGRYSTFTTRKSLTSNEARGLKRGALSLCATSLVIWKDETGKYCTMMFRCLWREPGEYQPPIFNWHLEGVDYNREITCPYEIR